MIAAMKKLYLIIHKDENINTIDKLQELGLVHIENEDFETAKIKDLLNMKTRLEKLFRYLNKFKKEEQKIPEAGINELLETFESRLQRIEEINSILLKTNKEFGVLLPWGRFDPRVIRAVKEKSGIEIIFYEISTKLFNKLDISKVHVEVISSNSSKTFFVLLSKGETIDPPAERVVLPDLGIAECENKIDDLKKEVAKINVELMGFSIYTDFVSIELDKVIAEIRKNEALLSLKNHEERFSSIIGWIPEEKETGVKNYLNKMENIVFYFDSPGKDDKVPILLKNSRFSRLFEPITKLFALPQYTELDLTPFFAPFFAMFFGLCLGDAGYGLVLLVAAFVAFIKFKDFRPILFFVMILGLFTIFWGVLTGTTFGMDLFKTELPVLSKFAYFKSDHLFYLALMIGLLQIIFAMILQAINKFFTEGILSAFSIIGWVLLAFFGTAAFLNWYLKGVVPSGDFYLGTIFIKFALGIPSSLVFSFCLIGVLLVLFFNDIKMKIHFRVLKGFWDLYGIITGFIGDLLSYIRLFALGVSSAILGNVINSIALQLLDINIPVLGPILFLFFVVVGHGGNLLLAALGSFVHPLRLTFVEFYKNAGFSGGGKPYSPLKKIYKV